MHDIIKKFLEADPSEIDLKRLGLFIGSIKGYNFINHEKYEQAIQQLEAKRSEVQKYNISIRTEKEEDQAKAKIERSKEIIRTESLILKINQRQVTIDKEKLTVNAKFSCGHEVEIPLNAFISFSKPYRWGTSGIITGGMNCPQCKKERREQIEKHHRYKDTPIGSISWELHRLK